MPFGPFFPKQFTVRGSQCFKEWSPWCWMVWSGSRPSCLPLPFICLPLPFICLQVLFICLPGHFLSFVSHLFSLSPRLVACGRVPGRLVFHFLSFVSHLLLFISQFFSFVSHAGLSPTSLNVSPTSFHLLLRLGACGPVLVSEVRHCWCHVAFLFICFPGPLLLLSALFRWPCSISIHLSPRSVTAGARPFRRPCSISIH